MYDQIELGTAPVNEPCVQVSRDGEYRKAMQLEAVRWKELLEKQFPPPGNARFRIKSFDHDFGRYLEVCAVFYSRSEEEINWAFDVEENLPEYWI